jgi:hypothetical protein
MITLVALVTVAVLVLSAPIAQAKKIQLLQRTMTQDQTHAPDAPIVRWTGVWWRKEAPVPDLDNCNRDRNELARGGLDRTGPEIGDEHD